MSKSFEDITNSISAEHTKFITNLIDSKTEKYLNELDIDDQDAINGVIYDHKSLFLLLMLNLMNIFVNELINILRHNIDHDSFEKLVGVLFKMISHEFSESCDELKDAFIEDIEKDNFL